MNTYKQAPHFKKQMHWFRLAGNFLALSNVLLFLIRCIEDFHVCSGQFVLHWYVGILRFLLSFPCSTVPGLGELAGPSVSMHSQMFTHVYLFITTSLLPRSANTHRCPLHVRPGFPFYKKGRITFWLSFSQLPEIILVICFVSIFSGLLFVFYSGSLLFLSANCLLIKGD